MMKTISAFLLAVGILSAQATQAPNPTQQSTGNMAAAGSVPIYRVTVVARSMKAINYNHRSGSTEIGFRGTALMPAATGEAKVESKQGVIKINADMQKLEPATKFGPEYLTYVMWAITPEGRATNVGEVLLNGGKSKLDATTELQSFGLIVTAEPYFAVTQPSDVVVMENFVRRETTGTIEELDAKFELLQRGQYTLNVNPAELKPRVLDRKVPLELYEARNAVQIARWTGAERYAADTYQKAVNGLDQCRGLSERQVRQQADRDGGARGRTDGRGRSHHHGEEDRRRDTGQRTPGGSGARSARGERSRRSAAGDQARRGTG